MKISRRMQRQVEIIIRHAQAQEIRQPENSLVVPERYPQTEKARDGNESEPR